jgi:hypothetical protein
VFGDHPVIPGGLLSMPHSGDRKPMISEAGTFKAQLDFSIARFFYLTYSPLSGKINLKYS